MYPSILQNKLWGDFQASQGHKNFFFQDKNYQFVAILDHTPLGNYLFVPYGPFFSNPTGFKQALSKLKKLARENNAIFIRIEPQKQLTETQIASYDLKKSKNIDPEFTRRINLDRSWDEILSEVAKTRVRHWKNAEKRNIHIEKSKDPKDIKILTDFLEKVSENNDFSLHSAAYLKKQLEFDFATLWIAKQGQTPIAAALIYDDENCKYYAHVASDYNFKNLDATSILVLQMMKEAQESGQKYFDLWGITTSGDKNDPWYGFSQFKASFGGEVVEYAGTYDLILSKSKYRLYQILRPINRLRRKISRKAQQKSN